MNTNLSLIKTPMPEQKPEIRSQNFSEVSLGYSAEEAVAEANRCLNCRNHPCMVGCPVNVEIPAFISKIANSDFSAAYDIITRTNSLPAVCGRVCPQESQCEARCVRKIKGEPVAIGRLERFAADTAAASVKRENAPKPASVNRKAAVVGSGPAGLTCAGDLRKRGFDVTVFEAFHVAGGVLSYGIPEFRLPKAIVKREIENLISRGVKIETNSIIGKAVTAQELLSPEFGFDAVFIGSGAGLPQFMGIPGEASLGVYSANEFLSRINLMKAYEPGAETPIMRPKKAIVVGGGNVAMDAARCARRLGAEVTLVYRRSREEMPAREEEVHHAEEEGIVFRLLCTPVEILADETGRVKAAKVQRMELGEADSRGRRHPIPVSGDITEIECDGVILAVGTRPNPLIASTAPGLDINHHGCIVTDEKGQTSLSGVYAGGDAVTGAATVILAMGAGKIAADAIAEKLLF